MGHVEEKQSGTRFLYIQVHYASERKEPFGQAAYLLITFASFFKHFQQLF